MMAMAQYATKDDLFFAIDPEGWANMKVMQNQVGISAPLVTSDCSPKLVAMRANAWSSSFLTALCRAISASNVAQQRLLIRGTRRSHILDRQLTLSADKGIQGLYGKHLQVCDHEAFCRVVLCRRQPCHSITAPTISSLTSEVSISQM